MQCHYVCIVTIVGYSTCRTKSNPTILERKESDLSVSDVCLALPSKSKMADASVQVTPNDWSNPFLTSFALNSQNGLKVSNGKSQSLQTTSPHILRRAGDSSSCYEVSRGSANELLQLIGENGEGRERQKEAESKLENILRNIQSSSSTNSLEPRASSEEREVSRVKPSWWGWSSLCMHVLWRLYNNSNLYSLLVNRYFVRCCMHALCS